MLDREVLALLAPHEVAIRLDHLMNFIGSTWSVVVCLRHADPQASGSTIPHKWSQSSYMVPLPNRT